MRKLADNTHPVIGKSVFPTIRELMCFAAVLGFENDRKSKLPDATYDVDSRNVEKSQQTQDLIYLVALASEKDAEILRDDNEERMYQIFEEYAQGGFEILEQWMKEKPDDLYGDEAVLQAFTKYGFLEKEVETEFAIADISFS